VFQTAWRAAEDATTPAIAAHLPRLRTLLSGTSSGDGATESAAEGDLIDTAGNLGLLNGAAGNGLALHTATTDAPPNSGWDACLLIG
jgi:class I lanthipeptide synthase